MEQRQAEMLNLLGILRKSKEKVTKMLIKSISEGAHRQISPLSLLHRPWTLRSHLRKKKWLGRFRIYYRRVPPLPPAVDGITYRGDIGERRENTFPDV